MYGNRLGWAIAAVLAVVLGAIAWQAASINALTPPTALLAETAALKPLSLDVPLESIVRSGRPGDSGLLYRRVITAVQGDASQYRMAETAETLSDFEQSAVAKDLLAAAPLTGDAGLDPNPDDRAGYAPPDADLDALLQAGRLLGHAGEVTAAADPSASQKWFEAEFALGAKLFDRRVRAADAAAGLAIARDAAGGLAGLARRNNDARRAALLATFDRAAQGLQQQRIAPLADALATLDGRRIAQHAGDVFTLTGRSTPERVWRVEAILALGRHRFNAERDADRLIVARRLEELEKGEADPYVLAAIHAAKGLTIEAYRTLR